MSPWRSRLHEIIFEADTRTGKLFDVALMVCIVASVVVVLLESVAGYAAAHGKLLQSLEWIFTGLFTVEYVLRLMIVKRPLRYMRSFFGIIDLLAILPTYLSLMVTGSQALIVIRVLRLLRVFRVLKMVRFVSEAGVLRQALRASARKIIVFMGFVVSLTVIIGAVMYLVEGEHNDNFDSIPRSMYWAVVTLTTVGYGDITPQTVIGQFLAALVMIMGYGIIAVPTGIVSVELAQATSVSTQACLSCGVGGHLPDARFCRRCGGAMHEAPREVPAAENDTSE